MGWSALVEALQRLIETTGDAFGGSLAVGILAVTLALRLLLIPILIPLATRSRDWKRAYDGLKPELGALKEQHRKDPDQLDREIKALHERHGIKMVDGAGLLVALIQVPVLIALFQAVYYVSQDTPLAASGWLIGLAAAAASVLSVAIGGQAGRVMLVLSAVLPIGISAWLGKGIAIYLLGFYAGSTVQSLIMRRLPGRTPSVNLADVAR